MEENGRIYCKQLERKLYFFQLKVESSGKKKDEDEYEDGRRKEGD